MKYDRIADKEKEFFGLSIRKLMNQSFIIAKTDPEAYRYLRDHSESISEYLQVMGYQLLINEDQMVIGLTETDFDTDPIKFNFRERLKKTHTAILACIWKLYIQKINEFMDPDEMWFELSELKELMKTWSLAKKELTSTELEEAFRLFSKHNLIRLLGNDFKNEKTRIQLLPSLSLCMETKDFNKLVDEMTKEYEIGGAKKDE